jgi:glycosyltransferase involved in cell wall biosynthesis
MISTLIQGIPRDRFSISLVTLMGDGSLIQKVDSFCEKAVNLQARSSADFRVIAGLKKVLRDGNFDILHTFLFHANILGRVLGRCMKIPVIISSQQSVDAWRKKRHILLDRWTSRFCDHVICVCQAAKERLESVEKIDPRKLHVIYNGLDVSEVPQRENNALEKEELGILKGPVIGMVGNFRGMKGHDIFVQAAKLLLKVRDDFHFIMVGDGKERKKYETEINATGLKNQFHFLGKVSNIYNALNLMDIFVLPSKWEGLPISILEAMAFKVPVIAADVGGISEVLKSGQTGLLISPNDPVALQGAVFKLLNDSYLRQKVMAQAYEEIVKRFHKEKMIDETVVIYEKFLEKRR